MSFLPQGPTEEELNDIISAANSAPDHGGLRPWRILILAEDRREYLYDKLLKLVDEEDDLKIKRLKSLCFKSPVLLVGIFSPNLDSRIPVDEQLITSGLALYNSSLIANELGYGTFWSTGSAAVNKEYMYELELNDNEKIIGFLHIGVAKSKNNTERQFNINEYSKFI
ncbi:hypothetical protein HC733_15385 [Pseudoalteromonas sp. S16_S37]|nr:hypothetical protein [Pseudoalteromonas sp. S16_S37]